MSQSGDSEMVFAEQAENQEFKVGFKAGYTFDIQPYFLSKNVM
jgi:hypothetical protein